MWVHFDNLAESLNKQVTNARTLRSEYETKVLEQLEKSNMKNATLKVNGANLQCATRFKSTELGWTMLEEQLHEYYKIAGKPDETKQIMGFLQKNRGGKTVEYLKKSTPQQPQIPPPAPSGPPPFALQPRK
jgi:hypothetical protein